MQSSTILSLNVQTPNYATVMHAVQFDKLSRKITAYLFDGAAPFIPPEGALAMVRYSKPDGTMGFYDTLEDETTTAVTWEGNTATVWLAEQILTVPGNVICQIQFFTSTERLSTFTFLIGVEANAVSDESIESTDYFSVLTQRIEAILGAVVYPPSINAQGHWMLFDPETQQYYDSGVDATGPAGPTGPTGPYMASIAKISGTGAPGTTDQYQVTLSDGTHPTGTIGVYQGQDGQGAPGSATPLMDGTASAGISTEFSRQDHVHPKDTSKLDASAFVLSTLVPLMAGTGAAGTSTEVARADHEHPSDTSKQDANVSGSNYIKFADGTLICWFSQYFETVNWSASWGSLYETPVALQLNNWPVAFNSTPAVFTQVHTSYGCWVEKIVSQTGTSAGKVAFVRPYSGSGSVSIYVLGIGRWKE